MKRFVSTAVCLASLCGCSATTEQCLLAADAHKREAAHKLCHGYTWRDCPEDQKAAVRAAYTEEQNACRPPQ